jgi:predicted nucleic acid-binding protein
VRLVLDASVVVQGWVDDTASAELCREILETSDIYVPGLIFPEVSHTLRRYERLGTPGINELFAQLIRVRWDVVSFEDYAELVWPLRHDISLYDAAYVALAMVLKVPLVTLDRKLATAATPYCEVLIPGE